jgi:hypothetical protein
MAAMMFRHINIFALLNGLLPFNVQKDAIQPAWMRERGAG